MPKTQTGGYKDLSSTETNLGFLGAIASSSDSSISQPSNLSTQHLKVKIEDIEYKIDNLMRKFSSIIDRIDLMEKKVDRNERRG